MVKGPVLHNNVRPMKTFRPFDKSAKLFYLNCGGQHVNKTVNFTSASLKVYYKSRFPG